MTICNNAKFLILHYNRTIMYDYQEEFEDKEIGLLGGAAKKPYLPIGKKSVCGKVRTIYKKNSSKSSSKEYMKHKNRYVQVKNFEKAMIAAGKWKSTKKTATKKSPKPCKSNQHRNPATGRCVKNKVPKSPKKKGRPRKTSAKRSARHSNRQGSY